MFPIATEEPADTPSP